MRTERAQPDALPRLTGRGLRAVVDRMRSPVLCRWCPTIYDLQAVKATARYLDCTVWQTPCCGRQVDDRSAKDPADFERVNERTIHRLLAPTDIYGARRITFVWLDGTVQST